MARRRITRRRRTSLAIVLGAVGAGLTAVFLLPAIKRFFVNPKIIIPESEITTREV